MKYIGWVVVVLFAVVAVLALYKSTPVSSIRWIPISEVQTNAENQPFAFTQTEGKIYVSYINDTSSYEANFPGADPNTFLVAVSNSTTSTPVLLYAKDNTHVYRFDEVQYDAKGSAGTDVETISGADPKTFNPMQQ
jgi:hypothetical protein